MVFPKDEKSKGYEHQFQQPVFQPVQQNHPQYYDDYASSHYYYQSYSNHNPDNIIHGGGFYGPLNSKESHWEVGFGRMRIIIIIVVFVILSSCFISIVVWMLFDIELPEFGVSSLSVPTFDTTSSTLVAKWDVDITILNPNTDLEVDFDHIITSIHFKNATLAEASVDDIHLTSLQKTSIHSALATEAAGTPLNQEIATEIEAERRSKGTITLNLRVAVNTKLTAPSTLKPQNIQVFCEDLTVGFSNDGVGKLTDPDSITDCLLYSSQ